MKTTTPKTPAQVGLSINVISGPRGEVHDNNWPCIAYTMELLNERRKVIWSGPYSLGVGHVKWPSLSVIENYNFHPTTWGLNSEELNVARIHARGQTLKKTPEGMAIEASVAAKLAKKQSVKPKLENVCHSLLLDGSAFFDGERFEDWANNLGYSSDSIKAKETFEACDRTGRDLSRALSRDDLEALREWASTY